MGERGDPGYPGHHLYFFIFLQNTQLTGRHMGLAWDEMVLVGLAMLNRPEVSASSHGRRNKFGREA